MNKSNNNVPDIDQLFDDLHHPNPSINKESYENMVRYWPKESIPILLANLDHEEIAFRRVCVKALGAFGESALGSVMDIFRSTKDRTIRTSCIKVMVQIATQIGNDTFPDEIIAWVEKGLEDEYPEEILTLVTLLRQLGKQGLPLLVKICRGENLLGVLAAVTALGEIDDPAARACLEQLLGDETKDSLIHQSILASLSTLRG